jgi:hypothetical protein
MQFSPSKQWILAGIISAGDECDHAIYAGIYTRVAFYLEWINRIIKINDRSGDPVLTIDGTLDNPSFDNVLRNISPCYHSSPLIFFVISMCLSFFFM